MVHGKYAQRLALVVSLAATVLTAPHPHPHPYPEPVPQVGGSLQLPRSTIEDFQPGLFAQYSSAREIVQPTNFQAETDFVTAATRFVGDRFPNLNFRRVDDSYQGLNGVGHVNFKQTINGYDLDNADVNVNIARDGRVLSYGSSAFEGQLPSAIDVAALTRPQTALEVVQQTFALPQSLVSGVLNQLRTGSFSVTGAQGFLETPVIQLVYWRTAGDSIVPAWRVETDIGESWLTSYVNAGGASSDILAVTDYAAHASYSVYKWPIPNPQLGSVTSVQNPENTRYSPLGWHNNGARQFYTTQGNNGVAQPNRDGTADIENEGRPQSSSLNFNFPLDLKTQDPTEYADFSATQLFYTANKVHDVFYALGFDEASGNFQDDNGNKGGRGGDGVILNTQDGSGLNNANFLTPPDGTRGRMRMYIWNYTSPRRDSSLDAGVVIHEYAHGLSNRLTGGSANGRCLTNVENRGLGEGWSDFYATAIRTSTRDTRNTNMPIGEYVFGQPLGIRLYPYSTSLSTNPLTYKSINNMTLVHQIGTVWNTILYEVMWNLIDLEGNSDAEFPSYDVNGVPTDGRWLAIKLVTDGLALQPCNPTMLQARDAILDADTALTGGAHSCAIWKGFAKRGLGTYASGLYPNVIESTFVPDEC